MEHRCNIVRDASGEGERYNVLNVNVYNKRDGNGSLGMKLNDMQ